MSSADLQRYIRFLEGMTAEQVEDLGTVMANNVRFVDPFNDVTGLESARAVFRHMFESLDKVRFRVSRSALDAGKNGLTRDTQRDATTDEVRRLKEENASLKTAVKLMVVALVGSA